MTQSLIIDILLKKLLCVNGMFTCLLTWCLLLEFSINFTTLDFNGVLLYLFYKLLVNYRLPSSSCVAFEVCNCVSTTLRLPAVYPPSTRHLPAVYRPSTRHLPVVYPPSTCRLPAAYPLST